LAAAEPPDPELLDPEPVVELDEPDELDESELELDDPSLDEVALEPDPSDDVAVAGVLDDSLEPLALVVDDELAALASARLSVR
jgi:hypothetical protein